MSFEISKEDKQATYVILPAYNEATRIQPVIEEIAQRGYNMIIVNDGSSMMVPQTILWKLLSNPKGNIRTRFIFSLS